jgi:hypothetical protein
LEGETYPGDLLTVDQIDVRVFPIIVAQIDLLEHVAAGLEQGTNGVDSSPFG